MVSDNSGKVAKVVVNDNDIFLKEWLMSMEVGGLSRDGDIVTDDVCKVSEFVTATLASIDDII